MSAEKKSTVKLEYMMSIQRRMQDKWKRDKEFDVDAGPLGTDKYFVSFPYPYMNGYLHLGHTFTLTKCEFASTYYRLRGRKSLFPMAFHCTGMPIKASADKLRREMDEFGFPPQFPREDNHETEAVNKPNELTTEKFKSKKSKTVAKTGNAKYQWEIMRQMGLQDEQIKLFRDPLHWLHYFPQHCRSDLDYIGFKIDWRRSFVTTNYNRWYDRFVRWQMRKLKEGGRIMFGKRYTIFCPLDNQPCMDHDRSSGEGVGPQEYILIKFKLNRSDVPSFLSEDQSRVFLLAATLRPETMYGLTNCWVHPDIEYQAVRAMDGSVFVCTGRSARNMAYQDVIEYTTEGNQRYPVVLATFKGSEIVGKAIVDAPLSTHKLIYVLPMLSLSESKGTGIVASVPSDSPDDFAALEDLRLKKALREKYGVSDEMILDPVPIIEINDLGILSAPKLCTEMAIKSQNDRDALCNAKEVIYMRGFYEGKMIIGEFSGKAVKDVKVKIRNILIHQKNALIYNEPEKEVVSRSGDECVVALCDQWYLDYGNHEWKQQTLSACEAIELFSVEAKNNLIHTIENLHEHACSRSYGLGSQVPWDEQYLIESLTDSTIYMAYYTISHLLKSVDIELFDEDQSDRLFNYLFCLSDDRSGLPSVNSLSALIDQMRHEFQFWYPLDLRCTGKDLLQNHIAYFIYTHCALFRSQYWPRAVNANGLLQLNSAKMSKSTGNFMTLRQAIDKYSADATRLVLADAGDTIEDANFVESQADAVLLRLYTFTQWAIDIVNRLDSPAEDWRDDQSFADGVFLNRIYDLIGKTTHAIEAMQFKEAVKHAFFELQIARDEYQELSGRRMNRALVKFYLQNQLVLMSVFCPHTAEYIYCKFQGTTVGSVLNERWPDKSVSIDQSILDAADHLVAFMSEARKKLETYLKKTNEVTHLDIFIATSYPDWQHRILEIMQKSFDECRKLEGPNAVPDNRKLLSRFATDPLLSSQSKQIQKRQMPFAQMMKEKFTRSFGTLQLFPFNEFEMFSDPIVTQYISRSTRNTVVNVQKDAGSQALPYKPIIKFSTRVFSLLNIANPEPLSGYVEQRSFPIFDKEIVRDTSKRLMECLKSSQCRLALLNRQDLSMPAFGQHLKRCSLLEDEDMFHVNESGLISVSKLNALPTKYDLDNRRYGLAFLVLVQ
ncbi:hypothetical protein ACOME3_008421 [Neoechinorhynchus agilis]